MRENSGRYRWGHRSRYRRTGRVGRRGGANKKLIGEEIVVGIGGAIGVGLGRTGRVGRRGGAKREE